MDTNEIPDPQTYALFRLFPYPPHAQDMGGCRGCQNYGPFFGTLNIWCRIIIRTQKGTIILTTTRMTFKLFCVQALQALQARLGPGSAVQARFVELGVGVLFSWCLGI